MSKKPREGPGLPGADAQEFMAVLLWSQSDECSCPAAVYFRKMAQNLIKDHIKVEER